MTDEERRHSIIEEISIQAEEAEIHLTMLGTEEGRHEYADAIVGVCLRTPAVIYKADGVIEELMRINDWSYEEAVEWFDYNTMRGLDYISKEDNPPIICF